MKKFVSKIAQSGFYIILFLCISAIGISAYVMYLARDTAETVEENIDIKSSLELPFPTEERTAFDFGTGVDVPLQKSEEKDKSPDNGAAAEPKAEVKKTEMPKVETPKNENPKTEKIQPAEPTVSVVQPKEEATYTMAVSGAVTAPFSGEDLVKSKTMGDWRIHTGVDIRADIGTDVCAIAEGTVKSVETDSMLGNTVRIEHAGGMTSIYANLQDGIALKVGDVLKNGDIVGKIGQSALCECLEEPHLHLEVLKDGKNIDPLSLFPAGEE